MSEFQQVLSAHPLKQPSPGCISVTEAFWLYYLVKSIQPKVIIESGTFEGYSLYFFRCAAPHAKIFSFDPFVSPKVTLDGVKYIACDWMQYNFNNLPGKHTIVFFDDHLNHGRRLNQALRHEIRHLLFHDNYGTPFQSHVPIRYCNLLGLARHYYIFDRLRCDPIFVSTDHNPQAFRWLTYIELETELSALRRLFRPLRYNIHLKNPYKIW